MKEVNNSSKVNDILSIINTIVGIIELILGLGALAIYFNTRNKFYILAFFVFIVLLVFLLFFNKKVTRYFLYVLMNKSAPIQNFFVENHSVCYECKSEDEYSYSNLYKVVPTGAVTEINGGRMKWTGGNTPKPQSVNPAHTIEEIYDNDGYVRRIIKFERPYNKSTKLISTGYTMPTLIRTNPVVAKALGHTVYNVTKNLELQVVLNSGCCPKGNARIYEYLHASDRYSFCCDENYSVDYEMLTKRYIIKWKIKRPFYGGMYMIEWD